MSYEDGVASLSMYTVDHIDSGKYRCEAYNQHGRVETACRVTVSGK